MAQNGRVDIDHLIDKTTGRLRRGVLLTPSEFREVAERGLERWDGVKIKLVYPKREGPTREDAPEEIRKGLEAAEKRHAETQRLSEQVFAKWRKAMNERVKFAKEFGGAKLTEAGERKLQALNQVGLDAEKEIRESEDLERQARIEVARWQNELARWRWDERLRRDEEAREKARAEKIASGEAVDTSFAGRLSRLKEKLKPS